MTTLNLTFDPVKHHYFLGEERLPSVSEVKEPLTDFSMVAPEVMARASAFGTAVHKMVELHLGDQLNMGALDEALFGPLEAFELWLSEVRPFQVETGVLIDVKSRAFDRVADPVQLAAYNQLVQENDIREASIERPLASVRYRFAGTPDIIIPPKAGGVITDLRILYLGMDGRYTYTRAYDPNAWPVFGHLLADYWRAQTTQQIIHSWRNRA